MKDIIKQLLNRQHKGTVVSNKQEPHQSECPQVVDVTASCTCGDNGGFYARCIVCRRAFTKPEIAEQETCPECGTTFKPIHPHYDTTARINWIELQTLACWAEQFAVAYSEQLPDMKKAVYAITQELEMQHPMKPPLTLGRELGILKQGPQGILVTNVGNVEPVPPKIRLQ